jgi:tetratricopeptide (TPR) repeat protein
MESKIMADLNIEDLGFEPIEKAPSQSTFNGIGTRLYGQSYLPESNELYTKVLYFTILYIPIIAFSRYLAHKYEGNEYILGKGKLSGLSKAWNYFVTLVLVGSLSFMMYQKHTSSPEYIAKTQYQESLELIEVRQFEAAINQLKLVYRGGTSYTSLATEKLDSLMEKSFLDQLTPEETLEVVKNATSLTLLFPKRLDDYEVYYDKFESTNPMVASSFADLIVSNTQDEEKIQLYESGNHRLLETIYKNNKDSFSIAQKYAALEERLNRCAACIEILEPHTEQLGTSEGARILGQAFAQQRKIDEAYALLSPYVEIHIKNYHSSEEQYNQALQKVWEDTIEYLNSGNAPASFYTEYDNASEQEQGQMVDDFYIKRRDSSAIVAAAEKRYLESTGVVPVALDLGMVLLNRASMESDSDSRNSLLQQAESTFLSVKNYAGDSDEFQLYLGQVYYWLGKEESGDALFAELLEKYQRSHNVLISLSSTLRDLGAFSKAQEYALEAYQNATELSDKQSYAQSLALLADDNDQKIEWLSKADQSNAYVKGDLLSSKGHKASLDNKNSEALNYYQQAIDVYKKIPESSVQFNNIALIYMSKYRIAFDQKDFDAALQNLDKAVALSPEDSIVLNNAASQHLSNAYTDLLSPFVDFKALEYSPSLSQFGFLYEDQQGKEVFRNQLRKHSSFNKAMSYMEKAMLLAPKNVSILDDLTTVYSFMDDEDALSKLVSRFKNVELDLKAMEIEQQNYRDQVDKEEKIASIEQQIASMENRARLTNNKKNTVNQTILQSYIYSVKADLYSYGKGYDANALLTATRNNLARRSSARAYSNLESAIVHKLLEQARVDVDGFEEFYTNYHRITSDFGLFCMSLTNNTAFKNMVSTSKLGKEYVSLIIASTNRFPDSPNIFDWKTLKELGHPSADSIAKKLAANNRTEYQDQLIYKRNVNKEYIAYHKMLKQELIGNDAVAKKIYEEAVSAGAIMPALY